MEPEGAQTAYAGCMQPPTPLVRVMRQPGERLASGSLATTFRVSAEQLNEVLKGAEQRFFRKIVDIGATLLDLWVKIAPLRNCAGEIQ